MERNDRLFFLDPGQCTVLVGPCSGTSLRGSKIPLDGRHYICAGTVILKNGRELRAQLRIQTHHFDFLERDATHVFLEDVWYTMDEPELYKALRMKQKDALPYTWLPDVPLDYHVKGPYPMDWYEDAKAKAEQE
jgi:hypothetical protein